MWFVGLGVLLVLLKLAGVPAVDRLPWWGAVVPFGLAAVWWLAADRFGITQRRAMADEARRTRQQREKRYETLGMRVPPSQGTRRERRD